MLSYLIQRTSQSILVHGVFEEIMVLNTIVYSIYCAVGDIASSSPAKTHNVPETPFPNLNEILVQKWKLLC